MRVDDLSAEPVFQRVVRPAAADDASVAGEPALADVAAADPARAARQAWFAAQWTAGCTGAQIGVFAGLCVLSGVFAVLCAFAKGSRGWGTLAAVVGAPVVEEVAKALGPLMVLEKKPWFFRGALSLLLVGLVSGFTFAMVENLLYFTVYIKPADLTPGVVLWRLVVCTAVHMVCAVASCAGLARAWTRAAREKGPFRLEPAVPFFLAAMALHGTYNFGALVWAVVRAPAGSA